MRFQWLCWRLQNGWMPRGDRSGWDGLDSHPGRGGWWWGGNTPPSSAGLPPGGVALQRQGKGSQVPGLRLMDGGWCATDWPEQWQSVTSQDACPYLSLLEAIWACTWGRARGGACSNALGDATPICIRSTVPSTTASTRSRRVGIDQNPDYRKYISVWVRREKFAKNTRDRASAARRSL